MEQLLEQIERASSQIVGVEVNDLPGLAELHTQLENVRRQADQTESLVAEQREIINTASSVAGDLIEKIILQDTDDAIEALEVVSQTCESLQKLMEQILRGGDYAQVKFPAELNLCQSDKVSEPASTKPQVAKISLPDNVDEEIFRDFLSSQPDVLASLESAILAVEKAPTQENVNTIAGILHNLKGESGLMGLQEISGFCHKTESMLIDAGDKIPVDQLFAALDWLQNAIAQLSGDDQASDIQDNTVDEDASSESPVADVPESQATDQTDPEEGIHIGENDITLVMDFINESREHLESAERDILGIEENPEDTETINSIFRAFHTIKGVSGFLNLKPIGELAHASENLLDLARNSKLILAGASIDVVFEAIDAMKHMLNVLQDAMNNREAFYPMSGLPALIERIKACAAGESPGKKPETTVKHQEVVKQTQGVPDTGSSSGQADTQTTSKRVNAESTVKISTNRMDALIDMVGELMVAQSMVSQDMVDYVKGNQRLERNTRQLNKITRDLQELSMSMRMVPVQGVFQKMARLVRDLSRKAGKEIEFKMEGADTELDRNLVESIADPLVHMVRNSVDHGIETPDERVKAGKPRMGLVKLSAFHQGGNIVIEIMDDGKGLNRDRILEKAIKKGVVKEGQELSDQEIYRLIFHAGLSTAEKVTDISGRGVGMDVVRKNIEALRGRVDIDSTLGKGTVFSIRLPLTLAVIDGQVVSVANEKYIIPLVSIESTLRPRREQISSIYGGKSEALLIHGNLLPLIRLYEIFDIEPRTTDPCEGLVVIVADGAKRCCVLVDDLAAQQQAVIKSLGSYLGPIRGVSGGSIMGDGNVALILDVPGLISLSQSLCSI
ncbi:MAG: chemotaxis protein CheA [Sedimentisphaerales bacterium]|nr:chemotaxis protein CheA [Sedimentisphaerales bacterium]